MSRRGWFAAIVLMVVAFAGCDPRAKQDVPPPPDDLVVRPLFVEIHAELQLLEAAYRQRMLHGGDRDALRAAHRARILAEAGVTDSALTATYNWWYSQPEALPKVLEEVQLKLDSIARNSKWN